MIGVRAIGGKMNEPETLERIAITLEGIKDGIWSILVVAIVIVGFACALVSA